MAKIRLDKLLGHMGFGSRKELKELVRHRGVTVNGRPVTDPGTLVDPNQDQVAVRGTSVHYQPHFWVLLHKPAGVITATEDPHQETVLDCLPPSLRHRELFPVGRLDKDTEGLLLLTTDGDLGHRLLAPKWHVPKRYWARLAEPLKAGDVEAFAAGIRLEDGTECLPALLEPDGPQAAFVTVEEGKYHQVKRMFGARGNRVVYLKRLSMGPLQLGNLPLGEARALTIDEVAALYAVVGLPLPV
jgi:16S rRNA pseudouridine516 synthase